MSQKDPQSASLGFVLVFFLGATFAAGSAVALTVLLYIWGYMGFIGSSPLVVSSCSTAYHTHKYSNLTLINETAFVSSAVASLSGILVAIIALVLVIKNCADTASLASGTKLFLSIMISLMLLSSIVPFGDYLTILIEFSNCTFSSSNNNQLIILVALAGSTFAFALVLWVIAICKFNSQSNSEDKYKQVHSHGTQVKEQKQDEVKIPQRTKYYTRREQQQRAKEEIRQQTKENIFDSPSKKALGKQFQPQAIYLQKKYDEKNEQLKSRFVPRNQVENPVLNLHPVLAHDNYYEYNSLKNKRERPYKNIEKQDQKYLREEQRRHYNQYDHYSTIIQNREIEERNRRDRDPYERDRIDEDRLRRYANQPDRSYRNDGRNYRNKDNYRREDEYERDYREERFDSRDYDNRARRNERDNYQNRDINYRKERAYKDDRDDRKKDYERNLLGRLQEPHQQYGRNNNY